jgi:hypothetical protein
MSVLALSALGVLLAGSAARASDWLPATEPLPLGAAVRNIFDAQAAAACRDRYVLYELEWLRNASQLTVVGQEHLDLLIRTAGPARWVVVIEGNNDSNLNSSRRTTVVNALKAAGFSDATARVAVGRVPAEGLYGEESVPLYPLFITSRFRNYGITGRFGGNINNNYSGANGSGMGFGMGGYGGYGPGVGAYGFGLYGPSGYGPSAPGYRGLGY